MLEVVKTNYKEIDFLLNADIAYTLRKVNEIKAIIDKDGDLKEPFYFQLVYRATINYLASASALIDYCRKFVKQFDKQIQDEHSIKVKEFFNNDLCYFVKDLRNYYLHEALPRYSIKSRQFHEGKDGVLYSLSKQKLLKWDSWKVRATTFIANNTEHLDMTLILKKYQTIVDNFYSEIIVYNR